MLMPNYQITLQGTEIVYDCSDKQTILGGMEKLGLKGIPVGCRGGGCGVCKIYVAAGEYTTKKMSRVHISEADEVQGYVLACRCRPNSDITLKVVGRMKTTFVTNESTQETPIKSGFS